MANDRPRRMNVPDVILYVEFFLTQFATIWALEARRLTTVVLVMSRHRALRRVAFTAARAREPRVRRVPIA